METPPKAAPAPFTGYQIFLVSLLALLQFTVFLDFAILAPLGDVLIKDLSITPKQFGLAVSVYAFSAATAGVVAAGFADKFDRKRMLIFFYAGFILGTFLCGIAPTYPLLLGARIVTGLFGGVIGSIGMAVVTDMFTVHQRGRAMGVVQMAFAVSQILGIPAGLYIAGQFGWHATFLAIVGLAFVALALLVVYLRPVNAHLSQQTEQNPYRHLVATLSRPRYQTGFAAVAFITIGGYMLAPFSSPYLVNNIKIASSQLPLVFMCSGLTAGVLMPLIGRLSDRYDKYAIFLIGSVLAAIMVVVYTHLPVIPLWQVVLVNVVMFAGILSRVVPAMSLNASIPAPADRGAYMSLSTSLQQMAGGVGTVAAGFIITQPDKNAPIQHFDLLGYVMVALMTIGALLLYRVNILVRPVEAAPPKPVPEQVAD